jgi:hypothetical protein
MDDELRGIINSGHTRDLAYVIRAEGEANEPRMFSTWAPKLVAAIGRLPDTVEDRAIRVGLTRKPTSARKKDAFDSEAVRADCDPVSRRLVRFALDSLEAISTAVVERPAGLHDRAWNNWKPLLSVASAAGGEWAARAAGAARALSENGEDGDGEDVGTLALHHVWEAVKPDKKVATADVLHYLVERDDAPWARWWESPIARGELKSPAARLAKLLRPFGIKPKQFWVDDHKTRGYDAADFATARVRTYLEDDGENGNDGRAGSRIQAGSTVFPSLPSFSEVSHARGDFPHLGDAAYPVAIGAALRNGHTTEGEWRSCLCLNDAIRRTLESEAPDPATASLDELCSYYRDAA